MLTVKLLKSISTETVKIIDLKEWYNSLAKTYKAFLFRSSIFVSSKRSNGC